MTEQDERAWADMGLEQLYGLHLAAIDATYWDKDTNMKIDQLLTSSYLKQSDVETERLVTIKDIKKQNVARKDEDAEYKYVLFFDEFEKGMVLNATNVKRLGKAAGNDTDDWIGKQVILYVDHEIEFGGNIVGGLRIRANRKPVTTGTKPKSDADINRDLDDAQDPPF